MFFSIFLLMVISNSCKSPLGLDEVIITPEANQYFPSSTGSYWIYNNVTDSLTTIDSVVVTGKKFVDGYMADEYTTFRNGQIKGVNFYVTDNNRIYIYSLVLEPLLDSINDKSNCYCAFTQSWKPIVKFNEPWKTEIIRTGDKYVSLVEDTAHPGNYNTVMAATYHRLEFYGGTGSSGIDSNRSITDNYNIDKSSVPTVRYNVIGNWYYGIDTNVAGMNNVNLNLKNKGYRNLDNKTVIVQDFALDIQFSKNIGIVKTVGIITDYINNKFHQTRTLIRYKIN